MGGVIRSLAAALLLAGCASAVGTPRTSIDPERDFSAIVINSTLEPTRLARLARSGAISRDERNAIIHARLAELDILYYEYETQISNDIRRGNFGANLAQILLGGAGSVASGGTSQNLSAVAAVVAGGKAAFDKDLLLDRSVQAFVSQMRASRAQVKARILTRLGASGSAYSLQSALSDLADYQQAGTLSSALSGITQSAQTRETAAAAELETVENRIILRRAPAAPTARAIRIRDWITSGASNEESALRSRQATECFEAAERDDETLRFPQFLIRSETFPAIEAAVVKCLDEKFGVTF